MSISENENRSSSLLLIPKIIFILALFFGIIGLLAYPDRVSGAYVIGTGLIGSICLANSIKKRIMAGIILSVFYLVETVVDLVFSIFWPEMIMASYFNPYYDKWVFADNGVLTKYVLLATAFFFIGLSVTAIVYRVSIKNRKTYRIHELTQKQRSRINYHRVFQCPLLALILVSSAEIAYRALGGTTSYFGYVFSGIELFCFMGINVNIVSKEITPRSTIRLILGILFFSLPGMYVGRRVFLLRAGLDVVLFFCLMRMEYVKYLFQKRKSVIVFLAVFITVLFALTNHKRFGVYNPLGLLVGRVVGLYDGSIVLDYLETNSVNFDFLNYLKVAFLNGGTRANWYYTYIIMGFPLSVSNGFAAPIFIISLMYGTIGWLAIVVFHCSFFAAFSKKAQNISDAFRKNTDFSSISIAYAFLYSDILTFILSKYFLDGNVEILKGYATSVVAFLVLKATQTITNRKGMGL